jgi:hypothetical protein
MTDMNPRHIMNHYVDFLDLSPYTALRFAHSGEKEDESNGQIDDFAEYFQRVIEKTVGERRDFRNETNQMFE